jgi:signal transduction histidine kinase
MRIVVHELRSPVTTSKSLVSALQYVHRGNPELLSVLGTVAERMDQLLDLVSDILYLSQVKAGKPLGETVVCDLGEEAREAYGKYVDDGEMKGLAMSLSLPEEPMDVRMDRQALGLVLSNLISNAVKYTREGSVAVRLRQEGPWAVVEVADTGIGIPAKDIPNLFQEFYRASNARGSDIQGTGVGLAGVKELVERFDGELALASKENEGSVFTARLPLHGVEQGGA